VRLLENIRKRPVYSLVRIPLPLGISARIRAIKIARFGIGPVTAFSKSATGKTDISFDI